MAECITATPDPQLGPSHPRALQPNMQLNGAVPPTDSNDTPKSHPKASALSDKITSSPDSSETRLTNNNTERGKFFTGARLSLENEHNSRHYDLDNCTEKITDAKPTPPPRSNDNCDGALLSKATKTGKGAADKEAAMCSGDKAAEGAAAEAANGVTSGNEAPSGLKTDLEPGCSSQVDSDEASPGSRRLRLENERLQAEVGRLRRLLQGDEGEACAIVKDEDRIQALKMELHSTKEALSEFKTERKRLKGEKLELLSHVRQLCASLQDKEQELRDFIRNYEQVRIEKFMRIRDTETSAQRMSSER